MHSVKERTAHPSKLRTQIYEGLRKRIEQATFDLPHDIEDPTIWSARFVLAAIGAEQRGLAFPWYMSRRKLIYHWHGGRSKVIELIAGLALGLMAEDPTLSVDKATLEAGNEFRQTIRRQWDRESGSVNGRLPSKIEWLVSRYNSVRDARASNNMARDRALSAVEDSLGLTVDHPADIEQEVPNPRIVLLVEGFNELTPLQQQAVELRSGGMTYQAVADELGMGSRTQAYAACKRAYRRLKKYIEEREAA